MADKTHTVYESRTPTGSVRNRITGPVAKPGASGDVGDTGAVWIFPASALPGITPREGDRYRAADGTWWRVRGASRFAESREWSLHCTREE